MQWVFGGAAFVFAVVLSYVNRRIGFRKGVNGSKAVVYVLATTLQELMEENEEQK